MPEATASECRYELREERSRFSFVNVDCLHIVLLNFLFCFLHVFLRQNIIGKPRFLLVKVFCDVCLRVRLAIMPVFPVLHGGRAYTNYITYPPSFHSF